MLHRPIGTEFCTDRVWTIPYSECMQIYNAIRVISYSIYSPFIISLLVLLVAKYAPRFLKNKKTKLSKLLVVLHVPGKLLTAKCTEEVSSVLGIILLV